MQKHPVSQESGNTGKSKSDSQTVPKVPKQLQSTREAKGAYSLELKVVPVILAFVLNPFLQTAFYRQLQNTLLRAPKI